MDPRRVLDAVLDGVESWLAAEAQLSRVVNAIADLASRMPVLQAVVDAPQEGEVESSAVSTLCKHVEEADRLYKYLQPLMSELSAALSSMEKAVAQDNLPSTQVKVGGRRDSGGEQGGEAGGEALLFARSVVGMFGREHWRKHCLLQVLHGALPEPCPGSWDMAAIGGVASGWGLTSTQAFTHVAYVIEAAAFARREGLVLSLQQLSAQAQT